MSSINSQPLTIHQFHYRASAGEAITQHMLFIREALAEIGVGGKIFSVQRKNLPQGKVQAWSHDSAWDCDLLLVHHSQYNPELKELLSMEIPKAWVYHSQPSESYFSHDLEAKKNLHLGRNQLSWFRRKRIPALGVSKFSISELVHLGFESASLLPLMHLELQKPDPTEVEEKEPRHLLFVGKIAPHKKQSLLIETFFHLRKYLPPHSKLHLVGTGDPLYTKYLKLLITQLGLGGQISLAGKITDSNLKEFYEMADAFICMSEYEGFCMPVVEAMKAGVPVFYRPLTGIKETMEGVGVELLTEDPIQNAVIIDAFLKSPSALKAVLSKQQLRLKTLALFQNRQRVQKALLSLVNRKLEKRSHEASLSF
ncbi:MAG: glycosyltransferase [Pseudomonadota bacterium]